MGQLSTSQWDLTEVNRSAAIQRKLWNMAYTRGHAAGIISVKSHARRSGSQPQKQVILNYFQRHGKDEDGKFIEMGVSEVQQGLIEEMGENVPRFVTEKPRVAQMLSALKKPPGPLKKGKRRGTYVLNPDYKSGEADNKKRKYMHGVRVKHYKMKQ